MIVTAIISALRWWGGALYASLPKRLGDRLRRRRTVRLGSDGLRMGERIIPLEEFEEGAFQLPAGPIRLLLEEGMALYDEVSLPEDASASLKETLALQISSLTPFRADEVAIAAAQTAHYPQLARIKARFAFIEREKLEHLKKLCAGAGLEVRSVVADFGEGMRASPFWRARPRIFLWSLLAALLSVSATLEVLGARNALHLAEMQLSMQRVANEVGLTQLEVQKVREDAYEGRRKWLVEAMKKHPAHLLNHMQKLAAVLPEHTYLRNFQLADDVMKVDAVSSNVQEATAAIRQHFPQSRIAASTRRAGQGGEHLSFTIRLHTAEQI